MKHRTDRRLFIVFFALTAILLVQPTSDSPKASEQFQQSTLQIITSSGDHEFSVELALTPAARAQGLQEREKLPPGTGMLFDFKVTQPVTMWMKNTPVSLDMLFITANGTIVNIVSGTQPFSLEYITSDGPVRAVLEVLAGTAKILGIHKGDRVVHDIFGATE